jgi:hypothetical protein
MPRTRMLGPSYQKSWCARSGCVAPYLDRQFVILWKAEVQGISKPGLAEGSGLPASKATLDPPLGMRPMSSQVQHPRSMILKPANLRNDARCGAIWCWEVTKRSNEEAEGFAPSRIKGQNGGAAKLFSEL